MACAAERRSDTPPNASGTAGAAGAVNAAAHVSAPSNGGHGDGGGLEPYEPAATIACAGPGTCALVNASCCGVCGQPTLRDVMTIASAERGRHVWRICGTLSPICPDCHTEPNPHLTATCRAGACVAVDVRNDELGACATDADCMLRFGTACCEPCQDFVGSLTAFARARANDVIRCGPGEGVCPECVPIYPHGARAVCNPRTKHCEVSRG
jgi:hypothetical protein